MTHLLRLAGVTFGGLGIAVSFGSPELMPFLWATGAVLVGIGALVLARVVDGVAPTASNSWAEDARRRIAEHEQDN